MRFPFPLRRSVAVPTGVIGALTLVGTALAWPQAIEGRPDNLHPGGHVGYYFWHDSRGLNLATTGPNPRVPHVYEGVIETDGTFASVDLLRPEDPDGYVVRDGDQRIRFHFRTYAGIDGINFRVDSGEKLTLHVKIDDQPAPVTRIFMGEHAVHPPSNPFTIYR